MADLRIVDAPEIPTENITGEEKLPTGGNGNYSISLDSLADYTKTKKDLADNTSVETKVNGVRQELDTHIEDLLNPHQVTKGQIGLGNVDNTADADKPVSNSTQAAIISAVSPKADKTYVDNQLTLKANKVDVYTKQESSDLVNNSISTALTTQQEVNDLFTSEGINILSVYGGIDDFGVAIELAHEKMITTGLSTIFIPDGTYSAKTTADITLTRNTKFSFGAGVVINTYKKIDIFNIEQQDKYLYIDGNGCYAYAQWGLDNTVPQNAIFKLSSSTLSKSCFIDNFNTEQVDGRHFWFGVNGVGLNYSLFKECLLQTHMPIWNESRNAGHGHSMGSIVKDCYLHAMAGGTCVTLVNNGTLACEGWSLEGGEFFCKTAVQVLDRLTTVGYYSPLLRITNVHMNCVRAARLEGVGRVQISGCDIQIQIEENNPFRGVFELLGVQSLVIGGGTTVSQAPTTGAAPQDGIPLISVLDHPTGKISALVNISNDTNLWLYQNRPLIEFQSNACYVGQLYFDAKAFTAKIVDAEFAGKVHLPESTNIQNWDVALNTTFSEDATFDIATGILILGTAPSVGNVYQVGSDKIPQWSTIKQVVTNNSIGKKYTLIIDSNVTIEHNANLYTPTASHIEVLNAPTTIELFSYNSQLSRIVNISNNTSFLKSSQPTSSASWGLHGMRRFEGGFVYEYILGTGWVRYPASVF